MRQQNGGVEGFGDIVVAAFEQGGDLIHGICPPGDEDDGNVRVGADLAADGKAGLSRQIQIQQDEVRPEREGQGGGPVKFGEECDLI